MGEIKYMSCLQCRINKGHVLIVNNKIIFKGRYTISKSDN